MYIKYHLQMFVMLTYQRLPEPEKSNSVMSCMKLVSTIKQHSHLPASILAVAGVVTSIAVYTAAVALFRYCCPCL